jgi:hypothetical protein
MHPDLYVSILVIKKDFLIQKVKINEKFATVRNRT